MKCWSQTLQPDCNCRREEAVPGAAREAWADLGGELAMSNRKAPRYPASFPTSDPLFLLVGLVTLSPSATHVVIEQMFLRTSNQRMATFQEADGSPAKAEARGGEGTLGRDPRRRAPFCLHASCRPASSSHCVLAPLSLQAPQTTAPFPPAPLKCPPSPFCGPVVGRPSLLRKGRSDRWKTLGKHLAPDASLGPLYRSF